MNGMHFLNTMSLHIKFITCKNIKNSKKSTFKNFLTQVCKVYCQCGVRVVAMVIDGECEPLRADLIYLKVCLNICSEDKHVHTVEHLNRKDSVEKMEVKTVNKADTRIKNLGN